MDPGEVHLCVNWRAYIHTSVVGYVVTCEYRLAAKVILMVEAVPAVVASPAQKWDT